MTIISFLLLLLAIGTESLDCPPYQQPCGSIGCYDPTIQVCANDGMSIECLNSCNGTCYSSSQYCYNDMIVCNNNESVCDVQFYSEISGLPFGLNCYDPSTYACDGIRLCYKTSLCGIWCPSGFPEICVRNQRFCSYNPWDDIRTGRYRDICGSEQQCYDPTAKVCVNNTTVCPSSVTQLCGTTCFNPTTQICINGTVQCANLCNGVCYSNFQYCYNNIKICNNNELVCDVKTSSEFLHPLHWPDPPPLGLRCYDPSQLNCYNNSLCYAAQVCGAQCLTEQYSACVNNETICSTYFSFGDPSDVSICGPEKQCYYKSLSVCLNGATICHRPNTQLCDTKCFNSDIEVCIDGNVQCANSCNGICYSKSQYCYNNTKICNNEESVCDVKKTSYFSWHSVGLHCYDPTQQSCLNGTLCYNEHLCGSQCLVDSNSACAKNQTICYGFDHYYYSGGRGYLDLCGPQEQCYDNATTVCLGSKGTICPKGNQLCSDVCYNPQLQYCPSNNSTDPCLKNPSAPECSPPVDPGD